jgi:hypothetical protein
MDRRGGGTVRREGEMIARCLDNYAMLVWLKGPTMGAIEEVANFLLEYEKEGKVIDLAVVIHPTDEYPDDAARSALAKSMRSSAISRIALVNEGTGFRASIVRSIISGIALLTRSPVPQKVFSSIEDAQAWLTSCAESAPYHPGELREVYNGLIPRASTLRGA